MRKHEYSCYSLLCGFCVLKFLLLVTTISIMFTLNKNFFIHKEVKTEIKPDITLKTSTHFYEGRQELYFTQLKYGSFLPLLMISFPS